MIWNISFYLQVDEHIYDIDKSIFKTPILSPPPPPVGQLRDESLQWSGGRHGIKFSIYYLINYIYKRDN